MTRPSFGPSHCDTSHPLRCPNCGGEYLHHNKIEIFERNEDAETGCHIVSDGEDITTNRDISKNPSNRRHGLTIFLWCELCHKTCHLDIAQHKGNTYMDIQ